MVDEMCNVSLQSASTTSRSVKKTAGNIALHTGHLPSDCKPLLILGAKQETWVEPNSSCRNPIGNCVYILPFSCSTFFCLFFSFPLSSLLHLVKNTRHLSWVKQLLQTRPTIQLVVHLASASPFPSCHLRSTWWKQQKLELSQSVVAGALPKNMFVCHSTGAYTPFHFLTCFCLSLILLFRLVMFIQPGEK